MDTQTTKAESEALGKTLIVAGLIVTAVSWASLFFGEDSETPQPPQRPPNAYSYWG